MVKVLGKQRADRPVNEPGHQGFRFAGAAFTTKKTAGNLAGGVGFLLVFDRQGEKVTAGIGMPGTHHGGDDHGIVHINQHCAIGLPGDFARFKGDGVLSPLKRFLNRIHVMLPINLKMSLALIYAID